jgi:hypothetical protein
VLQIRSWGDLAEFGYIGADDLFTLSADFFETLRAPQLPLPKLRRETVCQLRTTLQEMLADAFTIDHDPMSLPSLSESLVQTLDEAANELFHEVRSKQFDSPIDQDLLVIARWNLRIPKHKDITWYKAASWSGASTSYTANFEDNFPLEQTYLNHSLTTATPYLLKLYTVIQSTSAFYCKLYRSLLGRSGELVQLSSWYVAYVRPMQWSAYCAAVSKLSTDFKAFSSLVNDICNAKRDDMPTSPPFSVMRLMVVEWRRKVFKPLQESLLQTVLQLLSQQRSHLLSTFNGHKSLCTSQTTTGLGQHLHKSQLQGDMSLLCK